MWIYDIQEFRQGYWSVINLNDLDIADATRILRLARGVFPTHLYRKVCKGKA